MAISTITNGIQPILNQVIMLVITILGLIVINVLNQVKYWVETRVGAANYNRAREVAWGLYLVMEDEFKDIAKAGGHKKAKMEQLLLEKFPTLTQTELDSINKEIHQMWKEHMAEIGILDPIESVEPID